MATKQAMSTQQQRASFDSSVLSKRTSFEFIDKEGAQSKKRCSLEVKSLSAVPAAGFCGMPTALPPLGAPWAAPFQMPMGMPHMGGMMGGLPMGGMMPFCFPPPFIPPFMMPAAMAMWQQAVQQATQAIPGAPLGYGGMMPGHSFFSAAPSPAPPAPTPSLPASCDLSCPSMEKVGFSTTTSSSSALEPSLTELCDNDFETFIDSFLGTPEGVMTSELSGSALALASSFGCNLNLLGGSVSELSELTECCKPLDLRLSRDDSRLNLLDLDLNLEGECS